MTEPSTGLLSAFPELVALEGDPAIGAALRGTDRRRLYDVLRRWLGSHAASPDAMGVRQLLANRRRFVSPIGRAPRMFTLNGVGTRLYGESEKDAQDGSYIATLFATVVYLPVFPLSQYLVRPAGGRKHQFLGKVPAGPGVRWWRRLVGVGVVGAIAAGLLGLLAASRHATVHLVNGLDVPVEVSAAGSRLEVLPHQQRSAEWPAGKVEITTTTMDGRLVERASCDIEGLTSDLQAYSVAGVAPIYLEQVVYATDAKKAPQPAPLEMLAGTRCLTRSGVDDAFVDPPHQIDMDSDEETRVHVGLAPGGWTMAFARLESTKDTAGAAKVLVSVLGALPDDDVVETASGLLHLVLGQAQLLDALQAVADAHPQAVAVQRAYQDELTRQGHRDQALARAKAAFEKQPDSPVAGYLYARLLPSAEALPLYARLLKKSPQDVWLRLADAMVLTHSRQFAEAVPLFAGVWKDAPEKRVHLFADAATALVSVGRLSDALALAQDLDASSGATRATAVAYTELWRLAGGHAPVAPIDFAKRVFGPKNVEAGLAEQLALAAGAKADLSPKGASAKELAALALLDATASDPAKALLLAQKASPEALSRLGTGGLLLAGEELRTGDEAGATALLNGEMGEPYADELSSYWRTGVRAPELDDGPLDLQAAAELIRSRFVAGAARQALVKEAKADDVLRGVVTAAIARWPAPSEAALARVH